MYFLGLSSYELLSISSRLSSAGLIYAHFGLEVLEEIIKKSNKTITSECLSKLFVYLYGGFIEELDAIDNGIPMYSEGMPMYKINTHLGARVSKLNPAWNDNSPKNIDVLFGKAMELVGHEFTENVLEVSVHIYTYAYKDASDLMHVVKKEDC